ncbi:ATP-binding protein [Corynebacterium flavescens]
MDQEAVPGASRDDLDEELIDAVHRRLRENGSRVLQGKQDVWLERLGILTSAGVPTVAGLLALGRYPQQFFPRLYIDVAVHPGKEKSPPGTEIRFEDRRICDGNLLAMVYDTVQMIRKNLKTRRVVHGDSGYDVLEIPLEALREALANAVMHRDYSAIAQDQDIAVEIFKDRVEIVSPGGLPGGKSLASLDDGVAVPRNSTLARLLMEIPWPGSDGGVLAERNGSGIPRMKNTMREAGLPLPKFEVETAKVKVILYRFGLIDAETNSWLASLLGASFDPKEGIAVVLAKGFGAVTAENLRTQTGHDSGEMAALLRRLTERGILKEKKPGCFVLSEAEILLSPNQKYVYQAISGETPRTVKELSAATGKSVGSLRPVIRQLVSLGLVTATAPPTSRKRAYLRLS